MKRCFVFAILLTFGLSVMAAPLKNIEIRLTQPNGQIVNCFASGDEFYNYLHDANGFTIVQGEGGYYCYATKDDEGKVIASPYVVGSVDPAAVGLQPYVKISEQEYYARRQAFEKHIIKPQMKNGKELNQGLYNNLVVFIRFAGDTYHDTPFSTVETMFNGADYDANSLHNYYHHASYNKLDLWSHFVPQPDGETILSYEDLHPKEYYQPYDPVMNPIGYQEGEAVDREFSLLEHAINYIEGMVPESLDLDYNDDGRVDNVVFVIKGEPGEWASLLWPHRWCIYDRYVPLHDLQVYDYNLQLEQGGFFTVSTLCHEMFHSLGAPDLYHYNYEGVNSVGSWDLMQYNTEPPQQMNTYMKHKYGNWIDEIPVIHIEDPSSEGFHELESVAWEGGRRNSYMISTGDPNQYFLVEYRNKNDIFDTEIPGSGILIYLIDTRFYGNGGWNGNDCLDEVYLFRPGGTPTEEGDLGEAFFSEEAGRTSFNYNTDPYPFIHNQQYQFYDPGFEITDISGTGDRMSFNFLPSPGGEFGGPLIQNFTAHVNGLEHQVELSWDAMPYADYYKVFCDGSGISAGITDTTFVYPYTDADEGYHTFSVMYVTGGIMHVYHAKTYTWALLGDYETFDVAVKCNSPYGTKGGELEASFNHSGMKPQYFTVYEGNLKQGQLYVPANTEVTFRWLPGLDPEGNGIHVTATKTNETGQETLFNINHPTEGVLATYTVPEGHRGVMSPQHLTATTEGSNVRLKWTTPVENDLFKIYRDGIPYGPVFSGYEYLDDRIMRSGFHNYHVESTIGNATSWNTDNLVYATVMNYYCEPPKNLTGIHYGDHNELQWEAPLFVGHGMMAYDDNVYVNKVGSTTQKWGIKMEPELLAMFEGRPLTHLEMFDCSAGTYTFKIYNGENTNNNTLIYTQQHEMTASEEMVRFALDEAVEYDVNLPLWIAVESSGVQKPVPCCEYVGEPNSCLIKTGSNWRPATYYSINYSWLLRAYTSPTDAASDFSYNLYWGPEEGGNELMELGLENLAVTSATHNSNENMRYNVTAIWNGRETEFSNTVFLGPSVEVVSHSTTEAIKAFPNPTKNTLTVQGNDIQHIAIFTITGQKVFEQTVIGNEVTIDTESFPKGVYMMCVFTGKGKEVVKLVKQ